MNLPAGPTVHVCSNCHSRVRDYHAIAWWWVAPACIPTLVMALHGRNTALLLTTVVIFLATTTALLAWNYITNRCDKCGSRDIGPAASPPA